MKRIVEPEILDELPGDDPRAVRSRRDLRLINFLMGNERWILKQLNEGSAIVELGAGEGALTMQMAKLGRVIGLDFQEKPRGIDVEWAAGNLFETLPLAPGQVVVANLILHHFSDDQLRQLGGLLKNRQKLVFVEPARMKFSLMLGRGLFPFVNEVTKHDMMVSIRAGFLPGELPRLLDPDGVWCWTEETTLLGGIRVVGSRK